MPKIKVVEMRIKSPDYEKKKKEREALIAKARKLAKNRKK